MRQEPAPGRGRVLLVHRYFAPDTPPYATILAKIAGSLQQDGHAVTVLTAQPSYNRAMVSMAPARESMDGVRVRRWRVLDDRASSARKLVNLAWFCLRLVLAYPHFRRADIVMAATTPPVVVALTCSALARVAGADFVYHKQDIWPEVLEFQSGRRPSPTLRLLRWLDARTERRARAVVVLSGDMAETLVARGTARSAIRVINNFDPWAAEDARKPFVPNEVLDVVFAGNLGAFQGLEALVELIETTTDNPHLRWHFFGDGVLRGRIQELAESGLVEYYGQRLPDEVAEFVASRADLGVVSLNPGVIRAAYPSKTMTYLRNGCPILALVEDDSELAGLVRDRQLGVAGGHQDMGNVVAQLTALTEDPSALTEARARARSAYNELFAAGRQLEQWRRLMAEAVDAR